MKVWVVTVGEYSDYRIESVFLDEELARKHVEQRAALVDEARKHGECYDDYRRVEEYEVTDTPPGEAYIIWRVYGNMKDGLGKIRPAASIEDEPGPDRPRVTQSRLGGMGITVSATCADRDAAIKSVKDRLASVIATAYEKETKDNA